MPTPSGYVPTFSMPVIPAPATGDPTVYYPGLGLVTTAVNNGALGISFEITGAQLDCISMSGGSMTYIPVGSTLPDGSTLAGANGAVVIKTNLIDIGELVKTTPNGVLPMSYSMVLNVIDTEVRADLDALDISSFPEKILNDTWSETEASDPALEPRSVKEAKYLDRVMLGEKELEVDGGINLGKIGLNGSSNNIFTLRFGVGDPASTYANISPLLYLRNFPVISTNGQWVDHPLIVASNSFDAPLDIFVKFEVYDHTTGTFLPVDTGLSVELIDFDATGTDAIVATQPTDANGVAHFNFTTLPVDSTGTGDPDFYFKILSPTVTNAFYPDGSPIVLPATWQTKASGSSDTNNWKSKTNLDGLFVDFSGSVLGSPTAPLTYRIGLDFHVKFQYQRESLVWGSYNNPVVDIRSMPISTLVRLNTPNSGDSSPLTPENSHINLPHKAEFRLKGSGEWHFSVFDLEPGEDIFFGAYFEIEDASINLLKTNVKSPNPEAWFSSYETTSGTPKFNALTQTSIGSKATPEILLCAKDPLRAGAFDALKSVYEYHAFLFQMTNGDWPGVNNLTIRKLGSGSAVGMSWPVGNIFLSSLNFSSRETVIHETCHQIYWWGANWNTTEILLEGVFASIKMKHFSNLKANRQHAIVEGWPEFFQRLFIHPLNISHSQYRYIYRANSGPLNGKHFIFKTKVGVDLNNPDPSKMLLFPGEKNVGEKVEGAFASALVDIFWALVVGGATGAPTLSNSNLLVEESDDGDIVELSNSSPATRLKNPWLPNNALNYNTAVRDRFIDYIWKPTKDLNNNLFNAEKSTDMIDNMLNDNPSVALDMRGHFNAYNLAVQTPTISSLSLTSGAQAGGNNITLTGGNFIKPTLGHNNNYASPLAYIEVYFGNQKATTVTFVSATSLTVKVPPSTSLGAVNVKVAIVVHDEIVDESTLNNGYTYV